VLTFVVICQDDSLVICKWITLQAISNTPGNVANIQRIANAPWFSSKNPNHCYALWGGTGINSCRSVVLT
jgi:aminopeptidase N